MHLRERFPVHLPREQDFLVQSHFAVRNGNSVIEDLAFPVCMHVTLSLLSRHEPNERGVLEVSICSNEFQVITFGTNASACRP